MKTAAALLLAGMLILWVDLPTGSAWSCPIVRLTCALHNPRHQCFTDSHCPRRKKCCRSFCGRRCISKPPAIAVSYG
ncbi:ELAF protein, partial [Oriolus oriolus]|nr:ELAF protein [Oriolus oriolus]